MIAFQLSRRAWIAAGSLFILALLALMPMRFLLSISIPNSSTIAASGASGSIWAGRIFDMRAGSVAIGTIEAGLRPLGLLTADYSLWFSQPAAAGTEGLRGRIAKSFGGVAVEQLNGPIVIGGLLPGMSAVRLEFEDLSVDLSDGRCRTASGSIRSRPDSEIFAILGLGDGLIGRARCDKGDLLLPMTSGSGMERLELRISGTGSYSVKLLLQQPSAELVPLLDQAGLTPVASGYRLSAKGKFW
ncbi:MAG: type secretion system protein [Pseudomonadota bacterium]|jgi:general secretion pathway protein N